MNFSPSDQEIDFTGSLDIPGLIHVLHNAGRGLETALKTYPEASHRLSKLCNILRRKESKERLHETCFLDPVAEVLWQKSLKHFSQECYSERWGKVAGAIMAMDDDLFIVLDHSWDLAKYTGGSGKHVEQTVEEEHVSRLDLVDATLRDKFWASYWMMLRHIALVLLVMLEWVEGCSCHYDVVK